MKKHTIRFTCFGVSLIILALGITVYVLFRDTNLQLFEWLPILKVPRVKVPFDIKGHAVLSFLVYNLPDGLWLLSGIMFIRVVWWQDRKTGGLYVRFFITVAIALELLQLLKTVPGTFDISDLFLLIIIASIEYIINSKFFKRGKL
jgi:hypothetical protein